MEQSKIKTGIADRNAFTAACNKAKADLCAKYGTWNTTTAVEYYVTVVDEYFAQLPSPDDFDAGDLRGVFLRDANMNGTYNRLRKAGKIAKSADDSDASLTEGLM